MSLMAHYIDDHFNLQKRVQRRVLGCVLFEEHLTGNNIKDKLTDKVKELKHRPGEEGGCIDFRLS